MSAPRNIKRAPDRAPTIIVTEPIKPDAVPTPLLTELSPPIVALATVRPFAKPNMIQGIANLSGLCQFVKSRKAISKTEKTDKAQPIKIAFSKPRFIM